MRRPWMTAVAALTVMCSVLLSGAGAAAEPVQYVQFKSNLSGYCVLVRGGSGGAGAVQFNCENDKADQFWRIDWDAGWAAYRLRNKNSGLCLAVQAWSRQAIQAPCDTRMSDQHWLLAASTDVPGGFYIKNRYWGSCLLPYGFEWNAPVGTTSCLTHSSVWFYD